MERTVTKIQRVYKAMPSLTKVAAYARVSSGKDEMLHSLAAQVSYYSEYIKHQPGWVYAGVYADEALTGTKNSRPEFQRLLEDCRAGAIEIVLTKSISRFARNTVDLLEAVRELKDLGVDVYFEEQNIHTMSGDGELMLTILASFAQEESLSASENCKWRIRRNFGMGLPQSVALMGYRIAHGHFVIVPDEAKIVRMVFQDYLSGMGRNAIQRKLTNMGIKSKEGKSWHNSIIASMLANEKYVGDLMLQKYFRPDHLTKIDYMNKGEVARYYIRDHHEAIIDRDTFDAVQAMMAKRCEISKSLVKQRTQQAFTGKIICGECGKKYRRKTTHGKVSWQCGTYLEFGKSHCPAKQIPEEVLIDLVRDVLGLKDFSAPVFDKKIKEIHVTQSNHLLFVFWDGNKIERIWNDKSRRDAWTEEMRQKAREQYHRRRA